MTLHHPHLSNAQGALLGALIGDAAGATLEFLGRAPTPDDLDHALTLPGAERCVLHLVKSQMTEN